jgi:hypothetical protein
LDISELFSDSGTIFLTAAFFQPILPFAMVLAFIGNFTTYWAVKWILLRRA